jgi:hypothetical protein
MNIDDQSENYNSKNPNNKKHVCSIICPDLDFLNKVEIITDVVCPVPNCDEIFSQVSALNFHLEKVHRIQQQQQNKIDQLIVTKPMSKEQKLNENCDCKYFCPIPDCKFSIINDKQRFLPTFHSLKNHYIRIHGNKKFKCSKCSKSFSIKSEMERHETK